MTALLLSLASVPLLLGGNMVANQGFENVEPNGIPTRWALFVQPVEDTVSEKPFGRVDTGTKYSGERSVMLCTPVAYPQEPYNNWSQNIITAAGERTVRISGHIKTQKAEQGAAVWIQCWRKHPLGVCAFATTETLAPLAGDHDWVAVQAEVEAPAETEFLTVRCVLKGSGTAWFDDLSLEVSEPKKKESTEPQAAPAAAQSRTEAVLEDARRKASALRLLDQSDSGLTSPTDFPFFTPTPMAPASPQNPQKPAVPKEPAPKAEPRESEIRSAPSAPSADDARQKEDMLKANEELRGTLQEIRKSNRELSEQIKQMREELKTLREQAQTPRSKDAVPPIVPKSGYKTD